MTAQSHEVCGSTGPSAVLAPFGRLLVPVDFSSASREALALALCIADRWESEVILFHAAGIDGNDEFLDYTGVPWGRSDVVLDVREHLGRLAEAVRPGAGGRVKVDAARADDAVRAITDACSRHEPSLVVIGVHARARRPLLRTPAERIVRRLRCPVLIVRGEPEARVDPDE